MAGYRLNRFGVTLSRALRDAGIREFACEERLKSVCFSVDGRLAVACASAKVQSILAQIERIVRKFRRHIPYDLGHAGTFRRRIAG